MLGLNAYGDFNDFSFSEYQKEIDGVIPQSYADFLKKYNGGDTEDMVCRFKRDSEIEPVLIVSFFGVNRNDDKDILRLYRDYNGRIPSTSIPIAEAEGGNVICLNLSDFGYGGVYYWDHEEEYDSKSHERISDNMYLISESFDVFMESMQTFDAYLETDSDMKANLDNDDGVEIAWIDPDFLKEQRRLGNL